ncbi:MAG: hypothetical protein ACD_40C00131G0001 [uncultured bacterium]|nr:MAG: hypothetical protein ACD_40C00131G0001 [uncultured bacterium]KKU27065.1 MAG: hypothetical protein UX38_C0001G0065 [Microgenomates group bacterium GW2011_GWC1_46_16]KKU27893.1 MAG: hypothetical protein UX40_C0005G0046 [Microgenomates group bacterium GW2011_GWF2_46_18]KKU44295.1 MAG: hypothetical protein UX59_C0001G0014 [Microgenomates group bacterium GW2011_GWA1_46_7]
MIYYEPLGTSCFDVYQLFNICIPTLTKEVVKQSQKTTVNTLKTAAKNVVAFLFGDGVGTYAPSFALA